MADTVVGGRGKATTPLAPDGYIRINGELWHASLNCINLNDGDDIMVAKLDRLIF